MSVLTRRHFLSLASASAASITLPSFAAPAAPSFDFLFLTDSHIQPELNGIQGTQLAMRRARTHPADFAIQGGDHIMDALGVTRTRATQLFDQYVKTEQDLGLKVHHTLGNHDIFGVFPASGAGPADPEYGKKMFAERFGPTFYSFDHKGVHFIVLDSVGITQNPDWKLRTYEARIDQDQLDWLAKDLGVLPPRAPIVVTTHIPLVTAVAAYAPPKPGGVPQGPFINGPAVIRLLEGYNVLAVLQGHNHINETVLWRGIPYITSGAICGNWWHGSRMGTPEGFTVVSVRNGQLTTRYEPTGFQTIAPEPS